MDELTPITVFLDGSAVKRIREEKKLTQLYVSKVVGVTTDTISRWENNRYPTIKRDNALKLAEALEVDVDMILFAGDSSQDVNGAENAPAIPRPKTWQKRVWISTLISVILFFAYLIFFTTPTQNLDLHFDISRKLPVYAAPGGKIPVRILIDTSESETGFILREYFPKGWKLVQASPPASSLDNVNGMARWIIKPGDARESVVYMLQVDHAASPEKVHQFHGEAIVSVERGQQSIPVTGMEDIQVGPILWADVNGDNVIDDAEMLQASYLVDEMKGVHIDWQMLERLWDAGHYRWDAAKEDFVPVRK